MCTHSIACLFLSAASSLCRCSIANLYFVASPYSFLINRVVTSCHNFRLSFGSCLSIGLTALGITLSVDKSNSVAYSPIAVSVVWVTSDLDVEADEFVDPVFRHLMRCFHEPSKTATIRD